MGVGPKTENQKIEEKKRPSAVIKAILGTVNSKQRFTLVVALQGEIGASTMKCRDMKSKLKMVKHMKTTENGLLMLRAVVERMVWEGSGGWMKQVEEYMCAVGVSYEELTKMKKLISR